MIALAALMIQAAAAPALRSTPGLGMAEGRCRADESGPAVIVEAQGLKDRTGLLRAELYPSTDRDFLADDNKLIAAGKTFRRAETPVTPAGPVRLCIRAPQPGAYSLAVIHDRDGDRKFSLFHDGIGFPGNPRLGWSKPAAAQARVEVGAGPLRTAVMMNYRHGLASFGPVEQAR